KAISKYHKYRKDGAHGDCLNRSQVNKLNELSPDKLQLIALQLSDFANHSLYVVMAITPTRKSYQ
ncbi:hypothetical protein L9W73_16685, partial [Vibrio aestuarianus]